MPGTHFSGSWKGTRFRKPFVVLAVIAIGFGGDGWESNPPRTPQQRPANGFEDRGRHQPPNIPSAKMLVRQWDADALDAERLRVPGEQADQEAQHPVNLRTPGDRCNKRWLR